MLLRTTTAAQDREEEAANQIGFETEANQINFEAAAFRNRRMAFIRAEVRAEMKSPGGWPCILLNNVSIYMVSPAELDRSIFLKIEFIHRILAI